jgi:SAM-dependent methyltransferase
MGSSATQGELWGAAAWDWAELQEPLHKPVWEAMLDAAKVGQGTRFFDAGCGSGGASVLAAQRGANVSGLDASEALIAIARERVPDGDFRVGDLEALPYGKNAFDTVIAALSMPYAADPIAALRELKRVCAVGGYVAISTWGLPEHCEQRVVFEAVRNTSPSPPPGSGPFALSTAGLARLRSAARRIQFTLIIASLDTSLVSPAAILCKLCLTALVIQKVLCNSHWPLQR